MTSGRRPRLSGSTTRKSSTTSASPARSGRALRNSERIVATAQSGLSSWSAPRKRSRNALCSWIPLRVISSSAWSTTTSTLVLPPLSRASSCASWTSAGAPVRRAAFTSASERPQSWAARERARVCASASLGRAPGTIAGIRTQRCASRRRRGSNPACKTRICRSPMARRSRRTDPCSVGASAEQVRGGDRSRRHGQRRLPRHPAQRALIRDTAAEADPKRTSQSGPARLAAGPSGDG